MDTPVARSKVPFFGFILLILMSLITAIAIGALAAVISIYPKYYLVLIFPLFMGVFAGGAIGIAAKIGKVRSRALCIFLGLLTALLMYGCYRYGEYFLTKKQAYDANPEVSQQQTDAQIDRVFKRETGQTGFIGFVLFQAQEGIRIVPTDNYTSSSPSTDVELIGPTLYGYWVVEILIICIAAAVTASRSTSTPFCERDDRFFVPLTLGRVLKDAADQFLVMAKAGDWRGANLLLDRSQLRGKVRYPILEIRAQKCPSCNTNPIPLSVVRKVNARKGNDKVIFKATLTPEQYAEFAGLPVEAAQVVAY